MSENSTPRHGAPRADLRSPFVFDVRDVGRRAGSSRSFRRDAFAATELGSDVIAVPDGAPLALDVRLEAVTEGVLVRGTVTAPVHGECGRCLDPIDDELAVDVCELFTYPGSTTDETTERDEVCRLDGDYLDIEPVVREVLVLALPFQPLCRPDCRGLCPTCGQRLAELPAGHAHETMDPRWAALAAFTDTDDTGRPGRSN